MDGNLSVIERGLDAIAQAIRGGTNTDWWQELGRHTLSSSADTLTVTFEARKYIKILISVQATGGTIQTLLTFNGDTGNKYARTSSATYGAATSATSVANIGLAPTAIAQSQYSELFFVNIAGQEKIVIGHTVLPNTAGAGTAPETRENTGKYADTSVQVTIVTISNSGTGDFAAGSELVILGHD